MATLASCCLCDSALLNGAHGPLLACTGLCAKFLHESCYTDRESAGLCPDCSVIEKKDRKLPVTKNVFVRVLQLTNLTLQLHDMIISQNAEILKLRDALAARPPSEPTSTSRRQDGHARSQKRSNSEVSQQNSSLAPSASASSNVISADGMPTTANALAATMTASAGGKRSNVGKQSGTRAPTASAVGAPDRRRRKSDVGTIIGTGNAQCSLNVASPRPAISRIFVSRLAASTTARDVFDFAVTQTSGITHVAKFKNSHGHFSSFVITLTNGEPDKLLLAETWTAGIIVNKFRGRSVLDDRVEESFSGTADRT